MANEFKHASAGSQLSQAEYESITGHVLDSQAAGDIIYASSTTQLSRLGIGTAGKVLAVNSGASAPEYVAALTGVTSVLNTALVIGRDADNDIDFATDNNIIFRAGAQDQIKLIDGALSPVTDSDVDLGTSSLYYKDAYIDSITTTGNITLGGNLASSGDFTIDSGADIVLDADGADVLFKDAGTTYGSATNNSGNLIIKSGTTTALTFSGADVAVAGDLTITGDDLVMGTNTAGHLLIADGTNFNPTAVGDLSEISLVQDNDVLLAVDTSGGGLKKITRSTLVAGLATSSGISNIVEDASPELGGDLDVLERAIVTGASNRNIALTPHGTGVVRIDGTNGIDMESGAISIKNSGAESYVRFYCESGNAHYTQLQASPHSAYSGNVTVVLPAVATNLVRDDTTQTLTNKRLTSPKINEDVALTSTATELNLLDGVSGLVKADFTKLAAVDATSTELNIMDGNTSVGTTAVADGDGIVTNDGGTMKQTSVETFATYFGSEITNMSNLVETGALNAGSITSGFTSIDVGSGAISTTGAVRTGDINLGHASDTTIARASAGEVTIEGVAVKKAGLENMWIPATAMTPSETNGCASITSVETSSGRPDLIVLDFDKDSDEFAHFSVAMPKSWNEGTITFQAYWTSASTDTGTVAWAMSGVSFGDNDLIDQDYGTTVVATAKAHSGTAEDLNISAVSGNLTVANAAADELAFFEIFRDVSADSHNSDARLLGVKIFYTTDTSTDA